MEKTIKIDITALESMKNEATDNGKKDFAEWGKEFAKALIPFLKRNPLRYRDYGPYWWLVKKAIIDSEFNGFGENIEKATFEQFDYGNNETNLLVGYWYSMLMFEMGNAEKSLHSIDTEDGGAIEYTVADEEMEMLNIAKSLR